jgi:hypothetical protein
VNPRVRAAGPWVVTAAVIATGVCALAWPTAAGWAVGGMVGTWALVVGVRRFLEEQRGTTRAAAYRAAATEIEDRMRTEGYDLTCTCDACTPCLLRDYPDHLRARADEMEQQ